VPHTFSQDSPADRLTQVCRQVHAALEAREPESDTAYATRRAMERLAAGSELLVVLELAHRDLELRKRLRSILVRKWMLRAATDVLGRPPRRRQPSCSGHHRARRHRPSRPRHRRARRSRAPAGSADSEPPPRARILRARILRREWGCA
jgi:hypothetical protein